MKKHLSMILVLALLLALPTLPACAKEDASAEAASVKDALTSEAPAADPCEEILAGMTTEEKISQMIMPSFRYYTDGAGNLQGMTELTPEAAAILQKRGFAGVILFAQNTAETDKTVRLLDAMQAANAAGPNRTQLLTAIDQEGGLITRLGQGTQTPGNMALGAVGDRTATAEIAAIIGGELRAIGFNLDFAPVVDVNNNPTNPVIGTRSFSDDPRIVADQGVAFMQALRQTGTIATLKHFPGHGDTATDSHTGLPCIDKSYEELKQTELVPFGACIDAGAEAVMTAHIQYPQIETATYTSVKTGEQITLPATLSETILTDILRGDMGFDGVIVTDALNMDAIAAHFDRLDVARLAIEAGVDILLMPVDTSSPAGIDALDRYIVDVAALVDNGTISRDKVDAAVLRILHLKERHGLLTPYQSGDVNAKVSRAVSQVGSRENHAREWTITKRSVTLVKNENNVLPIRGAGERVVVLTAYDNETRSMEYAVSLLRDEGKLPADMTISVHSIQGLGFDAVQPLLTGADHVLVVSELGSAAGLNPATERGAYSAVVDRIIDQVHRQGGTVTVLSAQLPYDAARYQSADAILLAWSARSMSEDPRAAADGAVKQYGPNLPAALYLAFSPDESPGGRLPVDIPALDGAYQYTDSVLYSRGFGLTYGNGRFVDVAPNAWYAGAVDWAVEKGIMNGVGANTFAPDDTATRAMVVTMLWRLAGEPVPTNRANPFTDVSGDDWYYPAVMWAAFTGTVNGVTADIFAPNAPITREQLAAILYRYAQAQGKGFTGAWAFPLNYSDAGEVSAYAYEAMCWMTMHGVITGMGDGTLAPNANATRAQIATIFMRFAEAMAE